MYNNFSQNSGKKEFVSGHGGWLGTHVPKIWELTISAQNLINTAN